MIITFYTTHCPRCMQLQKKLDSKGIQYDVCTNEELMLSKGINSSPFLSVAEIINGEPKETLLNFQNAWGWVDKQ